MDLAPVKISVVITTRNEAKNLPVLLNSLVAQKMEFETIIVDSCSTDNTEDILNSYSEKLQIKFIRKKTSRGAGRNLGVSMSSGDYILFLDGDVYADQNLIRSYLEILAKRMDFVAGNTITAGVEEFKLNRVSLYAGGFEITAPSANLCYRKDVFEKLGGFDENFVTAEDIDLNFRAVIAGYKGSVCPRCIVYNRTRESLTGFLRQAFWNGYGRYQLRRKNARHWKMITKGKPLRENRGLYNIVRLGFGTLGYFYAILLRGRYP